MNNLQNKQLWPGQTVLNLVKHGQKKPIRFGFRTSLAVPFLRIAHVWQNFPNRLSE
jgi:hypothetical protein